LWTPPCNCRHHPPLVPPATPNHQHKYQVDERDVKKRKAAVMTSRKTAAPSSSSPTISTTLLPCLHLAVGSAPQPSNTLAVSASVCFAARCSAVYPLSVCAFKTSATFVPSRPAFKTSATLLPLSEGAGWCSKGGGMWCCKDCSISCTNRVWPLHGTPHVCESFVYGTPHVCESFVYHRILSQSKTEKKSQRRGKIRTEKKVMGGAREWGRRGG